MVHEHLLFHSHKSLLGEDCAPLTGSSIVATGAYLYVLSALVRCCCRRQRSNERILSLIGGWGGWAMGEGVDGNVRVSDALSEERKSME
ncbi:hypothetical protein Tco_0363716 [Tanacetum coccineum]